MDTTDFAMGMFLRLDRLIALMELAVGVAPIVDDSTPEPPASEPQLGVSGPRNPRRVSDKTYAEMAPKLVTKAFEGEVHLDVISDEMGLSHTTIREVVRRLNREDNPIKIEDMILMVTDPDKARKWLEPYSTVKGFPTLQRGVELQVAKVLKYLMRTDIFHTGRVSRRICEDNELSPSSFGRVSQIVVKTVPLCTREQSGAFRILPHEAEKANQWIREIESRSDWAAPEWHSTDKVSDPSFDAKAPQVVDFLLDKPEVTLQEVIDSADARSSMIRAVIMRLHSKEGVEFEVTARSGKDFVKVRLKDRAIAENWLSAKTAPSPSPEPSSATMH